MGFGFVFPGQGSQAKGMGKELFEKYRDLTNRASDILGYSLEDLCLNDPGGKLGQTEYTQPALYTVNVLMYRERLKNGQQASILAGHSLGEFSALHAAGAFDFETGLRLVQARGRIMAKATGGGMAAVIGLDPDRIVQALKQGGLDTIDVANFNSPSQTVISGLKADVPRAQQILTEAGAKMVIPLRVSAAFHSRYMEDAAREFGGFLENVRFAVPEIPVLSNYTARPHKAGEIQANLVAQLRNPVRWIESIQFLKRIPGLELVEVGPGNVLTKLLAQIPSPQGTAPIQLEDLKTTSTPTGKPTQEPARTQGRGISPETLGSPEFRARFSTRMNYVAGAMVRGIASEDMVIKLGRKGMLSFFGAGGCSPERLRTAISTIKAGVGPGNPWGMNLLCNLAEPEREAETVKLYLDQQVPVVEAAAYPTLSPALVWYRVAGVKGGSSGKVSSSNQIIAKISRPELAEQFMSPPPAKILDKLVAEGKLGQAQARLAAKLPMADALTIEASSGGHTDNRPTLALIPAIKTQRDGFARANPDLPRVLIGAAGGIGSPEAIAAAFVLGVDYVVTGSINQCTLEAGISDRVKDMLSGINIQDTDFAPAGDMFELGAKVQVLKKGVFFPARATKLYELYKQYNSLQDLDQKTIEQLEKRYFKKSLEQIWQETRTYFLKRNPKEVEAAEANPKHKMALVFRWYFGYATEAAIKGDQSGTVDYQVHCGPALGSFNQYVKGTPLENWHNRRVDEIATMLMSDAAKVLNSFFQPQG